MNLSRNSIVELRDGTRALIRPIGPRDRKRLNEGSQSATRSRSSCVSSLPGHGFRVASLAT